MATPQATQGAMRAAAFILGCRYYHIVCAAHIGVCARTARGVGQRLPMPVGIGRARMVNNVSDEDFERAFVQWEQLCKK